jgi:hypothetical protein
MNEQDLPDWIKGRKPIRIHDNATKLKRCRQIVHDLQRGYLKIRHTCAACSGSGYYDNEGSPMCSSCGGTGKNYESKTSPRTMIVHCPQLAMDMLSELRTLCADLSTSKQENNFLCYKGQWIWVERFCKEIEAQRR